MNSSTQMKCPLCACDEYIVTPDAVRNSAYYECTNCGKFSITAQACGAAGDDAWKLAPYVVEQNSRGIIPIFCSAQKLITTDASAGSVGVDAVIDSFPKSVAERLDRALVNL